MVFAPILMHQEGLPKEIRDISWKNQIRLCACYRRMAAKGKLTPVITATIACDIFGFA